MGAVPHDLREEVAEQTTCAVEQGVYVVTVLRRRPGSIVTEVLQLLEERMRGPDFTGPLQAVVDIRHSAFSPSGQEIRLGAFRLRRLQDEGRIALVVANDFQFGLGRMFGLLSEGTGFDVRPFRDPSTAHQWIRGA